MWTKQGKLWQFPVDNEQGKSSGSHGSNLVVALVLKKNLLARARALLLALGMDNLQHIIHSYCNPLGLGKARTLK